MNTPFSPEELQTLASYGHIAVEWAKRRSNAEWWRDKFDYFRTLVRGGRIVDIGCGTGKDAWLFLPGDAYHYIGIDFSPAMLALTKHYAPQSLFMRMNMYMLGFRSASFDGFWAAASLLHIPKTRIASVLAEIRRVMKSGAAGFIALKEGDTEEMVIKDLPGDNRFYAFYRPVEFQALLEISGFTVVRMGRDLRAYDGKDPHSIWLFYFVRAI